jgi:anti-anti-sigma factor
VLLDVAERRDGETALLTLSGELDIATGSQVIDAARRALRGQPERVTVDLGAVDFIDLTGIRALIHCRRIATAKNCGFVLAHPSRAALNLLEITGLRAVFEIET